MSLVIMFRAMMTSCSLAVRTMHAYAQGGLGKPFLSGGLGVESKQRVWGAARARKTKMSLYFHFKTNYMGCGTRDMMFVYFQFALTRLFASMASAFEKETWLS